MILIMIRPKNEIEEFLLPITKNYEMLIKETHRKTEETLEFTITKPGETFQFDPPISIDGSWMIGLTSLESSNSFFKKKQIKITISNSTQTILMSFQLKN